MLNKLSYVFIFIACCLVSCSASRKISNQARDILINDSILQKAHIGICIYEPATGEYIYNYNADKYFIPASTTKLFTLYAGMKYLGDSITGLKYSIVADTMYVIPTGDPTLLHSQFKSQPVIEFLKSVYLPIVVSDQNWKAEKYGSGWAWDDYNDAYMPERNAFPVFGNTVKLIFDKHESISKAVTPGNYSYIDFTSAGLLAKTIRYFPDDSAGNVTIKRDAGQNIFDIVFPDKDFYFQKEIPFVTNGITSTLQVLKDSFPSLRIKEGSNNFSKKIFQTIKTQPADSLYKIMMHQSDNFIAEQTLLMASNEKLGYMSDEDMISNLLNTDLAGIPGKPRWVDGSGLSRYNLFTPHSFVYILDKIKNEFGLERLKDILPAGNEGTLKNYFVEGSDSIFAKTGSLSNNFALSGMLITRKGKLLLFSIMLNNYPSPATPVRRAIERFLQETRKKN